MTNPAPDSPPLPRYQARADGGLDIDTVYTRCPQCSIVATSTGVGYAITAQGGFDETQPVEFSCIAAGHHYTAAAADFLPHDATCSCVRCGAPFAVPANADQVVCPSCRLYQDAPFLHTDDARRAELGHTRAQYLAQVRAVLRPAGGPGKPTGDH